MYSVYHVVYEGESWKGVAVMVTACRTIPTYEVLAEWRDLLEKQNNCEIMIVHWQKLGDTLNECGRRIKSKRTTGLVGRRTIRGTFRKTRGASKNLREPGRDKC